MALQDLLEQEIFTFDGRDFANWLKAGIPVYSGLRPPPPGQRVPDAFQFARGFIGRNEAGLVADLKDIYEQLPSVTRVEMEKGVATLWAETDFKNAVELEIGRTLLVLACRLQVKALVDLLSDALTRFVIAYERTENEAARQQIREIRRQAFQAAIELTSGSSQSIRCLELFMEDIAIDDPLLVQGQALVILGYLALKFPNRFVYWAGIFGHCVVADYKAGDDTAREVRATLEKAYGEQEIQTVIDMVREDHVMRIQTEAGALSLKSMRGLYDLVPILYAGREDAPEDEAVEVVTWRWEARRAASRTGVVVAFDRNFRAEMKGL